MAYEVAKVYLSANFYRTVPTCMNLSITTILDHSII
jgi:hypothetical protein